MNLWNLSQKKVLLLSEGSTTFWWICLVCTFTHFSFYKIFAGNVFTYLMFFISSELHEPSPAQGLLITGTSRLNDLSVAFFFFFFPWHSRTVSQRPEWPRAKVKEEEKTRSKGKWGERLREKESFCYSAALIQTKVPPKFFCNGLRIWTCDSPTNQSQARPLLHLHQYSLSYHFFKMFSNLVL